MNQTIRNLISLANLTKSGRVIVRNICSVFQTALKRQKGDILTSCLQIGKGLSGQIATMLTFVMVALLVLILVVVNIGDVTLRKTVISNATDAAALQLGSQMATMANAYYHGLGDDTEKCTKTGWCSIVIAAIVALVIAITAIVFDLITFGAGTGVTAVLLSVATSMIITAAGALGGAIAAGISAAARGFTGNALWNQVAAGAMVGAAVASAVSATAAIFEPTTKAELVEGGKLIAEVGETAVELTVDTKEAATLVVTLADGSTKAYDLAAGTSVINLVGGQPATLTLASTSAASSVTVSVGSGANLVSSASTLASVINTPIPLLSAASNSLTIGEFFSILMAGGSVAAAIYNQKDKAGARAAQAMAQYSQMINALNDADGLREGVFLSVLAQLVDDPNDTPTGFSYDCDGDGTPEPGGDPCDSDGDGDTQETIPWFQFWMDRRLVSLKDATNTAFGFVSSFWPNSITPFKDFLKTTALYDGSSPNYLARSEVEGVDGEIVSFLRTLENYGIGADFWTPGPTTYQLQQWVDECPDLGTGSCPADYLLSNGYDALDSDVDNLNGFVQLAEELQSQGANQAWQYWVSYLCEDGNDDGSCDVGPGLGSYYATFDRMLNGSDEPGNEFKGLYDWQGEIDNIEANLGECTINSSTGEVTNYPCKHTYTESEPYYYATTDSIPGSGDDEFAAANSQINSIISHTMTFMGQLQDLEQQIHEANVNEGGNWGGTNPVIYSWDDRRGHHEVTVRTPPNISTTMPQTRQESRGNWWSGEECMVLENDSNAGQNNLWVEASRKDTGAADRPVGILGFWHFGSGEITRRSYVQYDRNQVRLINQP